MFKFSAKIFFLKSLYLFLTLQGVDGIENYGNTSVFVPYVNAAKNQELTRSPTINIGFNGNPNHSPFVMDTGSVGIVASPDKFQPAKDAINLGPGRLYYSSSGIIEEGTWWTASIQIYDPHGNILATSYVPVLQVTSTRCAENARRCHVRKEPTGISMMGVGFARESGEQPHGTPDHNPFLNLQYVLQQNQLKKLPNDWSSGYVFSKDGVYLGLTPQNTAGARFIKLMPWAKYSTEKLPEWMPTPVTIKVNGVSGNGTILMDTGVNAAYLSPPHVAEIGKLVECPGSTRAECAPKGTVVHVYLPDEKNPVAQYSFTVGEENNPMQPKQVHIVKREKIFLNSSRHILSKLTIVYDHGKGNIGIILNEKNSHNSKNLR